MKRFHQLLVENWFSECGKVYTWGSHMMGRLGFETDSNQLVPRQIQIPVKKGHKVVDASAGTYRSALLCSESVAKPSAIDC
jgi:alpha-tubulin suppressor-like RCC1 family protein